MRTISVLVLSAYAFGQAPTDIPSDQKKDIAIFRLQQQVLAKDEEIAKVKEENRALQKTLFGYQEAALTKQICDAQKLPLDHCKIDGQKLTVSAIADPPKTPETPKQGEQK